jgi:adenine-specific DNA-methyltransferase
MNQIQRKLSSLFLRVLEMINKERLSIETKEPSEALAFRMIVQGLRELTQGLHDNVPGMDQTHSKILSKTKILLTTEGIVENANQILQNLSYFYDLLVPQEKRRLLGQFWTPEPVAELMVTWAIKDANTVFLDPGVGFGVFLKKAIQKFIEFGVPLERIKKQVLGYEISPSLHWMSCLVLDEIYQGLGSVVQLEDYLTCKLSLSPSAIVCNPPYTRHHQIPELYKSIVREELENFFGIKISRYSSLFFYFFLRSIQQLESFGRLAYITPSELFEAKYAKCLEKVLLEYVRPRAIIKFNSSLQVFPGADVEAIITLAEGVGLAPSENIKLVEITNLIDPKTILEVIQSTDESEKTFAWGNVKVLSFSRSNFNVKMLAKFSMKGLKEGWLPLKDFVTVMRGIATGANSFFLLNDTEAQKARIEKEALVPVIAKARDVVGFVLTHDTIDKLRKQYKPVNLLYIKDEGKLIKWPHVREYIRKGEEMNINKRVLVQTRKKWFLMEQRKPAPILYTYLSRKRPRFILNEAQVQALTTFLLIYPKKEIMENKTLLKAFLAILNSNRFLEELKWYARSYGENTIKIEPRELEEVPCPDLFQFKKEIIHQLSELFDELSRAKTVDEEEVIKRKVDEIIVNSASYIQSKNSVPFKQPANVALGWDNES